MQIPRVSSLTAQPEEQEPNRRQAQYNIENFEIPELEENSEEEQFADLDSYVAHHNTYQASVNTYDKNTDPIYILDDDQYYTQIDRAYYSQSTPAAQDYQLAIQQPAPQRSMEELRRYLAEAEAKPGEKSYTVIDHLAQELVPYKVTSSVKLRRISDYTKCTLITVNVLIP